VKANPKSSTVVDLALPEAMIHRPLHPLADVISPERYNGPNEEVDAMTTPQFLRLAPKARTRREELSGK
jgi:hypothetical protein